MPVEVLMPAPVNAIKCLDYFTRLANSVTFLSNSYSVSKYSFFSSSDYKLYARYGFEFGNFIS